MAHLASRRVLRTTISLSVITIFALLFWLNRDAYSSPRVPASEILPVGGGVKGPPPEASTTPSVTTSAASSEAAEVTSFFKPSRIIHATSTTASDMEEPTAANDASSAPAVKLRQGTYVGTTLPADGRFPKALDVFRGIPFAQSTAGENRFRPPVPLDTDSSQTFTATAFGDCCLTGTERAEVGESEDCLNLNVYRPSAPSKGRQKGKLPVAIYVHGGAFNGGLGTERNMASFVSWAEDDIIGVNFNYRVGAFGFLPSALTAKEGILNLGLRDQQALFRWVKENIVEFGGDEENITIMGVSAGAHSIGHHLMHYTASTAPFHKAILESGATTARATFLPTHPRHLIQFREFLIAAGIEGVPESQIIPTLRTLPAATILGASRAVWDKYSPSVCWPFQPVIDGVAYANNTLVPSNTSDPLLPDLPLALWRTGRHLSIPVLTGFNTNEGTIFVPAGADTDADFRSFFATLLPGFSNADLDALCALYPDPVTDPSSPYQKVPPGRGRQWARLDAAYAHYAYICPVLQTAHFLSQQQPAAAATRRSTSSPVYVYEYAALSGDTRTANHADEQPVVGHDMREIGAHPGLASVADSMHGAWVRFAASPARTGDPNGPGLVEWEAFESPFAEGSRGGRRLLRRAGGGASGRLMVFGEGNDERAGGRNKGTPARMRALSENEMEQCRFWWEKVELSEGLGMRMSKSGNRPSKRISSRL